MVEINWSEMPTVKDMPVYQPGCPFCGTNNVYMSGCGLSENNDPLRSLFCLRCGPFFATYKRPKIHKSWWNKIIGVFK